MKIRFAVLSLGLLLFASCANPVRDELMSYINVSLPQLAGYENSAIAAYESASGDNYTDDITLYTVLQDQAMPQYQALLDGLEELSGELETDEVRNLNEKYIEAVSVQNNAFLILLGALEEQDFNKIADFNTRLDKGRKLMRDWEAGLKKLAKANGVEFTGSE